MKISKIIIEKFRSINKLEFEPGNLCALIGENNSGKSNILKILNVVLGRTWLSGYTFNQEDFYNYNDSSPISLTIKFDKPFEYKRFVYGNSVNIYGIKYEFKKYVKGEGYRWDIICLDKKDERVMVPKNAPKKGVKLEFEPLLTIPDLLRDAMPLIYIGVNRDLYQQLPNKQKSLLGRIFEDVNQDFIQNQDNFKKYQDLSNQIFTLLKTQKFKDLEAIIKENILTFLGLNPKNDVDKLDFYFKIFSTQAFYKSLVLIIKEFGLELQSDNWGDGVKNIVVIAIFKAYEILKKSGAIILFEEPELFLHPHKQRFLFNIFKKISEKNQIIYTTHSPYFVDVFDFNNIALIRKDSERGTFVKKTSIKNQDLESIKYKIIKEFDVRRNELFFSKNILLVEGPTERLALSVYARRLNIDLDKIGVSIIESWGKKSLPYFIEMISSFDLPLVVVFDSDSDDFDKKEKDIEKKFNDDLLTTKDKFKNINNVFIIEPNYEEYLKKELGEEIYDNLCQKYGSNKVYRAFCIANDLLIKIPQKFKEIIEEIYK